MLGMVLSAALPAAGAPLVMNVSIVSPVDGMTVTKTNVPITAEFKVMREALVALELCIDGHLYDRYGFRLPRSGQYTFNWNTAAYTDGEHVIRVTAYGQYGSVVVTEAKVYLRKGDVLPPETDPDTPAGISDIAPQVFRNNPLTGTVTLSVILTGSGAVDLITYLIDGKERFYTNKIDKGFSWNTTVDYDGPHRIQASLLTKGCLLISQPIEVIVNNGRTVTNIAMLDYIPASGFGQERVESLPASTLINTKTPNRHLLR